MYSPDPFEQTHLQETLPPDVQTINEGPWSHLSIKKKKKKAKMFQENTEALAQT